MSATAVIYNIQRMSTQDGPGLRTTVFFKGCPLKCLWCSNPESQAPRPQLMHFANLCTGCGRCLDVCPSGAVRRENSLFVRDFSRCAGCGRCAEVCPSGAASMSGREMTVDDIMRAVRRDASFYFNSGGGVTFSGGECTMQGAFLADLLDACLAEGLHTCVDTCGQTPAGVFERVLERADLLLYDIKHMDSAEHRKLTGAGCETI
ncbi:MAG: glycyl-radical enzyme activating protein, partial [Desulfovibrionaceae bacterium]|nr:glycyl-radical enzyme activating protein [Desulfovibrionaceae bacterium]